jgi:hypothetical protein
LHAASTTMVLTTALPIRMAAVAVTATSTALCGKSRRYRTQMANFPMLTVLVYHAEMATRYWKKTVMVLGLVSARYSTWSPTPACFTLPAFRSVGVPCTIQ